MFVVVVKISKEVGIKIGKISCRGVGAINFIGLVKIEKFVRIMKT